MPGKVNIGKLSNRAAASASRLFSPRTAGLPALAVILSACLSPVELPEPPTGGRNYLLDRELFDQTVLPIFSDKGCDNRSCHGGDFAGSFILSPVDDKSAAVDFAQAALQITPLDPQASPLLLKPLHETGGGLPHTAFPLFDGFPDTADPDYVAILAWIEAGAFE